MQNTLHGLVYQQMLDLTIGFDPILQLQVGSLKSQPGQWQ